MTVKYERNMPSLCQAVTALRPIRYVTDMSLKVVCHAQFRRNASMHCHWQHHIFQIVKQVDIALYDIFI